MKPSEFLRECAEAMFVQELSIPYIVFMEEQDRLLSHNKDGQAVYVMSKGFFDYVRTDHDERYNCSAEEWAWVMLFAAELAEDAGY